MSNIKRNLTLAWPFLLGGLTFLLTDAGEKSIVIEIPVVAFILVHTGLYGFRIKGWIHWHYAFVFLASVINTTALTALFFYAMTSGVLDEVLLRN